MRVSISIIVFGLSQLAAISTHAHEIETCGDRHICEAKFFSNKKELILKELLKGDFQLSQNPKMELISEDNNSPLRIEILHSFDSEKGEIRACISLENDSYSDEFENIVPLKEGVCGWNYHIKIDPEHQFYHSISPQKRIALVEFNCRVANTPGREELFAAVLNDDLISAERLLANGTDPNEWGDAQTRVDEYEGYQTPLEIAVKNKNVEMIKLLLKYGADIYYACPIRTLLEHYDKKVFELIFGQLKDVDNLVCTSLPILTSALEEENWEAAKYLLKRGADPTIPAQNGKMPYCFVEDNDEMKELLEAHGASRRQAKCRKWRREQEEHQDEYRESIVHPNFSFGGGAGSIWLARGTATTWQRI